MTIKTRTTQFWQSSQFKWSTKRSIESLCSVAGVQLTLGIICIGMQCILGLQYYLIDSDHTDYNYGEWYRFLRWERRGFLNANILPDMLFSLMVSIYTFSLCMHQMRLLHGRELLQLPRYCFRRESCRYHIVLGGNHAATILL